MVVSFIFTERPASGNFETLCLYIARPIDGEHGLEDAESGHDVIKELDAE